jgi:hypothetical protein
MRAGRGGPVEGVWELTELDPAHQLPHCYDRCIEGSKKYSCRCFSSNSGTGAARKISGIGLTTIPLFSVGDWLPT